MKKIFEFKVKGHHIKIVNSWIRGVKLYVDGDFRDQDKSLFAFGDVVLSANLGEHGVLEVYPLSGAISVEMDAYLRQLGEKQKDHIYSSHQAIPLSHQLKAM